MILENRGHRWSFLQVGRDILMVADLHIQSRVTRIRIHYRP